MADNITLPVLTKDVGGYHAQKIIAVDEAGASLLTATEYLSVRLTDGAAFYDASGGGTQYTEDAASVGGEDLTLAGAVRRDTPASSAGADGDYATLNVDANGRLYVTCDTVTTLTGGGVAHDAVDSGNPVKIGSRSIAALSGAALVAAADRSDALSDLDGALIVRRDCPHGDLVNGNATNTDGTSTQCIAAAGSGIKTVLTDITMCNSSATAITVDIKDGTTVKWSFPVPAGGGVVFAWNKPLIGTANTAWNFDPSAAATTVTCSMSGYKSKV